MFWLIAVLLVVIALIGAWWSSGRAGPNTRRDGRRAIRDIQARGDDIDSFRRPGRH